MLTFRIRYFIAAAVLFVVELLIAIFAHDRFVRPYLGDFLVVLLMYCFARTFFTLPVTKAAVIVLLFAYAVEISQYFHFISYLGWEKSAVARTIFGWSFAWTDIAAYTLGIFIVLLVDRPKQSNQLPL